MPPNRRPLQSRDKEWARALARWLTGKQVPPNAISTAGMFLAAAGAACYLAAKGRQGIWPGILLAAAAGCVQLRLTCNLMDGLVALEGGLKGKAGDLFNEAPDRFEDIVLLAGVGLGTGHAALGWMAAAAAILTAYVRALGGALGRTQDFCGPFAKQQRMFFLTVGTLGAIFYRPILVWTLWLIAAGAAATAVRRVARLYRTLP